MSRAVVVVGADGKVAYTELVPEIAQEPNYDAALAALLTLVRPSIRRDRAFSYSIDGQARQRPRRGSRPMVRPGWSATRLQARTTPGMKLARS